LRGCTLERTTFDGFIRVAGNHVRLFGGRITTPNTFPLPPNFKIQADLFINASDVYVDGIDISNTGGLYPTQVDYNYFDKDEMDRLVFSGRVQACIMVWGIEPLGSQPG